MPLPLSRPMHSLSSRVFLVLVALACQGVARAQSASPPLPTKSASIVRGSCPSIPATPAAIKVGTQFVARYKVLSDGNLGDLTLETSTGIEDFDKALLEALSRCKYSPAIADGQPIDGEGRLVLPFRSDASSRQAQGRAVQSCAPTADDYPPESRRQLEEGKTRIRFTGGADGKLQEAVVAVSSGYVRLDRAAAEKLSQCKFRAGRAPDGTPIGGVFEVKYVWTLQ